MTKAFFQSPFVLQPSRIDSRWDNIQLNVVSDFRYVEGYPFHSSFQNQVLFLSFFFIFQIQHITVARGGGESTHTHRKKDTKLQ